MTYVYVLWPKTLNIWGNQIYCWGKKHCILWPKTLYITSIFLGKSDREKGNLERKARNILPKYLTLRKTVKDISVRNEAPSFFELNYFLHELFFVLVCQRDLRRWG